MEDTLLYRYIRQEPGLFRTWLDERNALTSAFAKQYRNMRPERVVVIGSGSSHHAALMARQVMERAFNAEVTCVASYETEGMRWFSAEKTLYFAVSQSGRSTDTYEAVSELQQRGIFVTAITEDAETPIAKAAGLNVLLSIGEERVGAKTKGVVATVVTLVLLALSVCADAAFRGAVLAALERIANHMEENLECASAWADERIPGLLDCRNFTVLGDGADAAAAREGALKLLETGYRPVCWYPLGEYLHGVQNALDAKTCLVCLLPENAARREQMLRLASFARSVGARCEVIAADGASDGALGLRGAAFEPLSALEYLPALQVLAAGLSAACRIDASARRYPAFYSAMGSKMDAVACRNDR
jgi:glucoselysine-6-phosphate deglycase